MPTKKRFIAAARRDCIITEAVKRALYAMRLANGVAIECAGMKRTLQFEHEMAKLEQALQLLNGDPNEPLRTQRK